MADGGAFLQGFNSTFNPVFQNQRDFLMQMAQLKTANALKQREQILRENEGALQMEVQKQLLLKNADQMGLFKAFQDLQNKQQQADQFIGPKTPEVQAQESQLSQQENNIARQLALMETPGQVYMSPEDRANKVTQNQLYQSEILKNNTEVKKLAQTPVGGQPPEGMLNRRRYVYLANKVNRTADEETEYQSLLADYGPKKSDAKQLRIDARDLAANDLGFKWFDPNASKLKEDYTNHYLYQLAHPDQFPTLIPPKIVQNGSTIDTVFVDQNPDAFSGQTINTDYNSKYLKK